MSNAADLVRALRSVETFGAGTSKTAAENLSALNAGITYMNSIGGGALLIPEFYNVAAAPTMKSSVILMGRGYGSGFRVQETSDSFDSSGLILGNYGTATASSIGTEIPSIFAETRYNLNAISAGAKQVTCATAADAANFAAGDIVHIGSSEMSSTGYEKYQMLNEVISSDAATGIVVLKYAIADAMAVTSTEGELYFTGAAAQFVAGRTLTDTTSGATCTILGVFMGSNHQCVGVNSIAVSTFAAGHTVQESVSGNTAVIATGGVQLNPMIRKLNTGNVTGLDGNAAGVVVRAGLRDLRIEMAKTSGGAYQGIHFSAFEPMFDNIWVKGVDGLGGNPLAFAKWRNVRSNHRRIGLEMAYCCNDNDIDIRIARLADYATTLQAAIVTSEDGGADNRINARVESEYGTVSTQSAIGIIKRRTQLTGYVKGSIGSGVGIGVGGDFSSVRGMHIYNPTVNGLSVAAKHCDIGGNIIRGQGSTARGIRMTSTSGYCSVHDNIIGDRSSPQTQDTILDDNGETTTNKYSNNSTKLTQRVYQEGAASTYSTVAENTLYTYTIPANTVIVDQMWEVEFFGSITGTNGQKDVRLKVAGTTVATITMAAGTTGAFWCRALVCAQAASSWAARGMQDTAGTIAAITGSNGVSNVFSNATDIILTQQVANAGDAISVRAFSVRPFGDQFQG